MLPKHRVTGFVRLPPSFFAVLAGLVIGYSIMVEPVKYWFYQRYSTFIGRNTVQPASA